MKLEMRVDVQSNSIVLENVPTLITGNQYEPFVLKFSTPVQIDKASCVRVEALRHAGSDELLTSSSEFSFVSGEPNTLCGSISFATDACRKWAGEAFAGATVDQDPATQAVSSCWIRIIYESQDSRSVFAANEVSIVLDGRTISGLPEGDSGGDDSGGADDVVDPEAVVTRLELAKEVERLQNLILSSIGKGNVSVVRGTLRRDGRFTDLAGTVVSVPDYSTFYYDTKTSCLYMHDGVKFCPAGGDQNLASDVVLAPTAGYASVGGSQKTHSLKEEGQNGGSVFIPYLEEAVLPGYLKVGNDGVQRFYTSDDVTSHYYVNNSGALYLNLTDNLLYWYGRRPTDERPGYYSVGVANPEDVRAGLVTEISASTSATESGSVEVNASTRDDKTVSVQIAGLLGASVIRGSFGDQYRSFVPEGGTAALSSPDPRMLYQDISGSMLYYYADDQFKPCVKLPEAKEPPIKAVTLNGEEVEIEEGVAKILTPPKSVELGAYDEGTPVEWLAPGVLYINPNTKIGYINDSDSPSLIPVFNYSEPKNYIKSVVVNGSEAPSSDGTVTISGLLTEGVTVGRYISETAFNNLEGTALKLQTSRLYFDVDSRILYASINSGTRIELIKVGAAAESSNTASPVSIKISSTEYTPDKFGVINISDAFATDGKDFYVKNITFDGVSYVPDATGSVQIQSSQPQSELVLQKTKLSYLSYESDIPRCNFIVTSDDVLAGVSIFRANLTLTDAAAAGALVNSNWKIKTHIDVHALFATPATSNGVVYNFEAWLRNGSDSTVVAELPSTVLAEGGDSAPISWTRSTTTNLITVPSRSTLMMAFRLVTGGDGFPTAIQGAVVGVFS